MNKRVVQKILHACLVQVGQVKGSQRHPYVGRNLACMTGDGKFLFPAPSLFQPLNALSISNGIALYWCLGSMDIDIFQYLSFEILVF